MSDNAAVKSSLLKAPWKKVGELEVEAAAGARVLLYIRRPPPKASTRGLKACQEAGLVDAKGEATSPENGVEFAARMFAPMIFLPGEDTPLFTPEELAEAAWFNEAAEACKAALDMRGSVEAAKGN